MEIYLEIGVRKRMSDYNLLVYYYTKWQNAETNEGMLNVLVDYIMSTNKNEEYSDYFGVDLEAIDFFDKYDIEDFMEENVQELEQLWKSLIKRYIDDNE